MRRTKAQPFVNVALLAGLTIILTFLAKFPTSITEIVPILFLTPQPERPHTRVDEGTRSESRIESTLSSSRLTSSLPIYNNSASILAAACATNASRPQPPLRRIHRRDDLLSHRRLSAVPSDAPASVARYAEWHASARKCFEPTATPCKSLPPVLVYRCLPGRLCAGVGDRLRGIVATFLLSIATRRLFFIDWPPGHHSPFHLTAALLPASVDWTLPPRLASVASDAAHLDWYDAKDWNALSVPNGRAIDLLTDDFNAATASVSQLAVSCNAPYRLFIYALSRNAHLRHSVPDMTPERISPLQLFRSLFSTLFTPSYAVADVVAAHSFKKHLAPIAVHVRTGEDFHEDAPRLRQKARGHLLARSLWACAQRVAMRDARLVSSRTGEAASQAAGGARVVRVPSRMFITGDDDGVKHAVFEHAINAGMKGEHVRVSDAVAMHIGLPSYKAPQSHSDKCAAFITMFTDLLLMARAAVVVTSGSGFAKAATYFGNVQELWIASVLRDGSSKCARAKLNWLIAACNFRLHRLRTIRRERGRFSIGLQMVGDNARQGGCRLSARCFAMHVLVRYIMYVSYPRRCPISRSSGMLKRFSRIFALINHSFLFFLFKKDAVLSVMRLRVIDWLEVQKNFVRKIFYDPHRKPFRKFLDQSASRKVVLEESCRG